MDALDQLFALPAGYVYLTPEEAELVKGRVPLRTPSAIIGCGLDPVARPPDVSRLADLGIEDPFVLYLGRIDPNKGCDFLMRNFLRYAGLGRRIQLVMAGPSSMDGAEPRVDPGARFRRRRGSRGAARAGARAGDAVAVREPEHGAAGGVEPRGSGAGECALPRHARPDRARERRLVFSQRRRVRSGARLPARPRRHAPAPRRAGTGLRGSRIPLADGHGEARGAVKGTGGLSRRARRKITSPCKIYSCED